MRETIKYMCRVDMWLNTCWCLVLRVMPLVNIKVNKKKIKKINKIKYNGSDRNTDGGGPSEISLQWD
jgi:hypothetical protein